MMSPATTAKLLTLKNKINQIDFFDGARPLLYLHQVLNDTNNTNRYHEQMIDQTIVLVEAILDLNQELKKTSPTKETVERHLQNIMKANQALVQLAGKRSISKTLISAILQAVGFVIGFITGIFYGFAMVIHGFIKNKFSIKDFFSDFGRYYITGALLGAVFGSRALTTSPVANWINDRFDRQLHNLIDIIDQNIQSLPDTSLRNDRHHLEQQILKSLLCKEAPTQEEVNTFLSSTQNITLVGMQAQFFVPKLKGSIGYHGLIAYQNSAEQYQSIEIGGNSTHEEIIAGLNNPSTQQYHRTCTGRQLLDMLVMNNLICPQYTGLLKNINKYTVGQRDCHTYIDVILASVGLEMSEIQPSLADAPLVSKKMISCITREWTLFPEKPKRATSTPENTPEGQSPRV